MKAPTSLVGAFSGILKLCLIFSNNLRLKLLHLKYPDPSCDPCPITDTEYEEAGGLQEKLERLNTMMGGTGAEQTRRMQYLTHCEYTLA